jgi:hypothetical protein
MEKILYLRFSILSQEIIQMILSFLFISPKEFLSHYTNHYKKQCAMMNQLHGHDGTFSLHTVNIFFPDGTYDPESWVFAVPHKHIGENADITIPTDWEFFIESWNCLYCGDYHMNHMIAHPNAVCKCYTS